jgi:hypothetical protein
MLTPPTLAQVSQAFPKASSYCFYPLIEPIYNFAGKNTRITKCIPAAFLTLIDLVAVKRVAAHAPPTHFT